MGLFYGKRSCNRIGGTKRCFQTITTSFCPCLIDRRLHGHPIVMDSGSCILAIQLLLRNHYYLLIRQKDKKIFFYHSTEKVGEVKKTFPGYKVYPGIKGGKKCLP